jgi:hypothetical protein
VLLLLTGRIDAYPDELRIERGELAGTPTEVGRLERSARGIGLGVEEDDEVLLAAKRLEVQVPATVLGRRECGERIPHLYCHRVPSS